MFTTLKSRLTLGLSFLFVVILLLSGVGAYFLYSLSRSTAATLQDNYRSVEYARFLTNALSDLREARLTAGPEATATPAYQQARQEFQRYLTAELNNITEPGEQELADSLATSFRQWESAAPAAQTGLYQQLRGQIGRVAALNLRAIEQQSAATRRVANRTIGTLGLLAAVGILATLSFIFSFPDYLTRPGEELTAGIRRVADGDYSQRRLERYETAEGTPRIDATGPLDLVTSHRRPGSAPEASAAGPEQLRLVEQLRQQARQLQRTADALLGRQ